MKKQIFNIGIFIYNNVEVLDFCGPFEVFNNAAKLMETDLEINIFTIAEKKAPINAQGLSINPKYSFKDCPKLDILLIPGGDGLGLLRNKNVTDWIEKKAKEVSFLTSVCTGALPLGKIGLLNGLKATTHHQYLSKLKKIAPEVIVVSNQRYVESGKIITSGGISAGIDMSLGLCTKLWGKEITKKIVNYMEYNNKTD